MAERNYRSKHPEIDIQAPVRALIGAEPVPAVAAAATEATVANSPKPETEAEKPLDIPALIRLFQTDAYPIPEGAPVRIAVSTEASLTLYPDAEAVEYQQQTKDHTIYLRASKSGEVVFSLTPVPPVAQSQEPSPTHPLSGTRG
jgi:negative regulator of sigma E activity